jgi:hypothetical protein
MLLTKSFKNMSGSLRDVVLTRQSQFLGDGAPDTARVKS